MGRLTRNTWEGGQNTDTDKSKLNPTFYTDAHNVESVSNGNFFSLKNIQGTVSLQNIINVAQTEVLGVFANNYLIDGNSRECLTIFTATTAGLFKVWCYDIDSSLYELYEEQIENDYLTADRTIDAKGHAENGIDHIYFTDDYNEFRFIRCEIPSPYVANFLSSSDISVQRRGANGKVTLDSILTGGSLLSGAYQLAYRMADPVKKRFTKWSSLSLPIHVYSAANLIPPVYSDYGLPTEFKIRVDITPTTEELNNFDYFQVAVVEAVYPTGPETIVDGNNQTFVASLLPISLNTDYLSGTVLQNFEHKTNAKVGVVPIEDIVVDLAAIKSPKTLNVKQNRLVGGNIKYHNLEFDNGDPTVSAGGVITHTNGVGDLFSSHEESIYRGYFRDEVYRFGIIYKDKFGNRSPVKVLDLSAIGNNQISGGLPDLRFPSRATSNSWTLFDTNASPSRLRSLGVNMSAIHNHPTWAVGLEILRVKRKERILSQTPVIPMTYVQGIGALDDYPSQAVTVAGGSPDNEYPDAHPQTTSKIYIPKNLFWPDIRAIKRRESSSGSGTTLTKKGEVELLRTGSTTLAMIYPQNFMYGDGVFILSGAEKLETVDYCTLRVDVDEYSTGTEGDKAETKIKGNFYALDKGDYYFDPAWTGKSISDAIVPIKGNVVFQNLSVGSSLNGKKIMDYDSLQTTGVDIGFKPLIQKSVVIETTESNHDIMVGVRSFANAGNMVGVGGTVPVFSSNPTFTYQGTDRITNQYSSTYTGFTNNGAYVQAVKIANIVNNYADDRYGDVDFQHEFISTGASYHFSTSELVDVAAGNTVNVSLDVWGGDCFVAPHIFKVSDGTYSVVNQEKHFAPASADSSANLIDKWTKYFLNTGGAAISIPVGVGAAAQFITVVLESKYNGGVMAQDILEDSGTSLNGMPVLTPSGGEEALRSPLTYRYNLNLSKQNDEKIYFPRPTFNFEHDEFPARVVYSDPKIYNTDETGFDIFRVLNFLDLEEKNGSITKLSIEGDNLYAIQEKGIVNLPVGETQISTTDAGQLSIGTSDFFGRPIILDEKRGSQHLRTIVETGELIYIADNANKAIYTLSNNSVKNISNLNNETLFRNKFEGIDTERQLIGIYDGVRKQYWIASALYAQVFNENKQQWTGNLEFPVASLKGGVFTKQNLNLIGKISNQIAVHRMYSGSANTLFGTVVVPRVTFVVNPDEPITKKFDNQAYISTERLETADFTVEREQELSDQVVTGTVIAVSPIGGSYRLALPRASGNERLRGLRMITTVKWKTDGRYASLSEILTKYRLERRIPF